MFETEVTGRKTVQKRAIVLLLTGCLMIYRAGCPLKPCPRGADEARKGNNAQAVSRTFPFSFQQFMSGSTSLRIALGGDHAGFPLKQVVVERLNGISVSLIDCGTNSSESCDYPDFAVAVAKEIIEGRADRGIVVCGSGVGVSVAANKIPGIRAAVCHDTYSAHQGVEHDDMNVLCIGGRIIGSELAFEIIDSFLRARYVPQDRHARRLEKVLQIERRGLGVLD